MARKSVLGRGLGALIPGFDEQNVDSSKENLTEKEKLSTKTEKKVDNSVDNTNKVLHLPLSKVEPREGQPRMIFDEKALGELADSIKQHGVLQPILVLQKGKHYEIVAGERRWRAAKLAGIKTIPAIVKEYKDEDLLELALIENIQRENLNPIEEAQAYKQLIEELGIRQEDLAGRVSKSRSTITNSLRLLKLDERVQAMIMDGRISEGHARSLLGLSDKSRQLSLAEEVLARQLSVRETERLVKSLNEGPVLKAAKKPALQDGRETAYDELVLSLRKSLGTKVDIRRRGENKGQLIIEYYSLEDLENIIDKLR